MSKKTLYIILAVVALAGFYTWGIYNRLVTANEQADSLWAQVETQYQRRFDLIPNLTNSVQGIFNQEKAVFGQLAEARTRYAGAGNVAEKVAAANQVETSLARLLVVLENYPQLRSSEAVQNLMVQLEGTENRISVERKRFNDGIRDYNLLVKRFPARFFAALFGFGEREYFEAAQGAETAPKVEL
jgi:LemA protein